MRPWQLILIVGVIWTLFGFYVWSAGGLYLGGPWHTVYARENQWVDVLLGIVIIIAGVSLKRREKA